MDWREMETFKGVDLNDSFVLEWVEFDRKLEFILDASLWPESPHYRASKPNEYTCYRRASLKFSGYTNCVGLKAMSAVTPSPPVDGEEPDYGNIDVLFKTTRGFVVEGDFGSVAIEGGHLCFTVSA